MQDTQSDRNDPKRTEPTYGQKSKSAANAKEGLYTLSMPWKLEPIEVFAVSA